MIFTVFCVRKRLCNCGNILLLHRQSPLLINEGISLCCKYAFAYMQGLMYAYTGLLPPFIFFCRISSTVCFKDINFVMKLSITNSIFSSHDLQMISWVIKWVNQVTITNLIRISITNPRLSKIPLTDQNIHFKHNYQFAKN